MAVTKIGVLTSGGDASGMNAAVRAIVRTGLDNGLEVFAIHEGYRGLIEGGDKIRPLRWPDVGGIIHRGGKSCHKSSHMFGQRSGTVRVIGNDDRSTVRKRQHTSGRHVRHAIAYAKQAGYLRCIQKVGRGGSGIARNRQRIVEQQPYRSHDVGIRSILFHFDRTVANSGVG